ncbi:hypothetical protein D1O33_09610 [Rhodococcus rhodochrous]|nr:hypothetical protein D1O33_09610 [Rhodococcus rhodochrous]
MRPNGKKIEGPRWGREITLSFTLDSGGHGVDVQHASWFGDPASPRLGHVHLPADRSARTVATCFESFPLDFYFWLLLGTVGCALTQHWSTHRSSLTASDSAPSHSARPAAESGPTSASC